MKSIWPKIPAPFVRAMLAGHSALGLAFAATIYLVCLTGSIVVFAHELERWERPAAPYVTSVTPAAVERLAVEALARDKGVEHLFIDLPTEDLPRLSVYVDREGENDPQWYASHHGAIVADGKAAWTNFLVRLHINLHLPQTWGVFIVGLTGVALLSSLVSGLFAHPRVFRDAFYLRWGGSKRLQEADLHNRIGVWGLPFHIIVSLTGALLGLTTIIVGFLALALFQGDMDKAYAIFLPPALIDNPAPAPLPKLTPMFETVARELPGSTVDRVFYEHPGEKGQGVMMIATRPLELSNGSTFIFDGDGKLVHKDIFETASLGGQILQAVSVLHFGWFGGWAIKIVYALLGLGLTFVTTSGVAIWLARRRDKGRPAPRWESVWVGFVWSQPLIFALCALLAIVIPAARLIAIWIGLTATIVAPAAMVSAQRLSVLLRVGTALLTLAVALVHVTTQLRAPDTLGLVVDGVIALIGAGLIASTLTGAVKPST